MSDNSPPPEATAQESPSAEAAAKPRRRTWLWIGVGLVAGALVTLGITALLVNIVEKRQEAAQPYFKVVELDDKTVDPAVWGQNFPMQYETYLKTKEMPAADIQNRTPTADDPRSFTAQSKLEKDPRLVTMWQGYAFSVDYREPRGHYWMLEDQRYTKRVTSPQFKQPGACLNCHASTYVLMNELGNGDINAGFAAMNKMTYQDATAKVQHPVACIDCHDPKTMQLRITRPAFIAGIAEYKAGQGIKDYDVNRDASSQDKRVFVCAQCHVEYYFAGAEKTLTFPWDHGLKIEDAEQYYNEIGWVDFTHKLTGANVIKAQHPDFETWSQGVHARAGVTCADCHMPYLRVGAQKISDHQVRSPMASTESINASCLTCHHATEEEMKGRVEQIHERYEHTKNVSFNALDALIKDIEKATASGVSEDRLNVARAFQRRAQFYVDYVVSENSRGFHAPAYTNRVLNDATDACRQGQLALFGVIPAEVPGPYPTVNPNAPAPSASPAASATSTAAPTPTKS